MMKTVYLSAVIGDGTDANPFRPALAEHVRAWSAVDGGDAMLVTCDPTPAEAKALAADARIDRLAELGIERPLTGPRRAALRAALSARAKLALDPRSTGTEAEVVAQVGRAFLARQHARAKPEPRR